jgi:sulfur carrier protein
VKVFVNGSAVEARGVSLGDLLAELGYGGPKVATAVNERFVPAAARGGTELSEGDRIEVVAPRQGG